MTASIKILYVEIAGVKQFASFPQHAMGNNQAFTGIDSIMLQELTTSPMYGTDVFSEVLSRHSLS